MTGLGGNKGEPKICFVQNYKLMSYIYKSNKYITNKSNNMPLQRNRSFNTIILIVCLLLCVIDIGYILYNEGSLHNNIHEKTK
jgi:ABC-type multidrug transport system permease subunit